MVRERECCSDYGRGEEGRERGAHDDDDDDELGKGRGLAEYVREGMENSETGTIFQVSFLKYVLRTEYIYSHSTSRLCNAGLP